MAAAAHLQARYTPTRLLGQVKEDPSLLIIYSNGIYLAPSLNTALRK